MRLAEPELMKSIFGAALAAGLLLGCSSSSSPGTGIPPSSDAGGSNDAAVTSEDAGSPSDGSVVASDGGHPDAAVKDGGKADAAKDGATEAAGGEAGPAACSADGGAATDGGVPLDCVSHPSACCYPDETNTGVPPGTKLTPAGSMEIKTDGTVISGLDVTGTVDIYANNVTIKNTRITISSSGSYALAIRPGMTGAVIQDTTIEGQDNDMNSVEYAIDNFSGNLVTIERVNLFNCSECAAGGNITITDSYIHDTADPPGAHVENIYGYSNTILRHNTMFNSVGQTAVVYLDPGPSTGCEVSNNFLAGGGYTIYGGSSSSQDSSNVVITNNRFSKTYYPMSGYYGVVAYYDSSGPGDSWSGNFWDDTGAPIDP
jgi:hypothetical protein